MSATYDPEMLDLLHDLSGTLVGDEDAERLLHQVAERCAHLLKVEVAGIQIADERGVLRLLAAAPLYTAHADVLEADSTPGSWCFAAGLPMADADLRDPDPRWTAFGLRARDEGFLSVTALPMRVRDEVVGVLTVLRRRTGALGVEETRLAQALANLATVGLLLHRDPGYRSVLAGQAQRVLTGRVAVERARGVLAELFGLDVDSALPELTRHAQRVGKSVSAAAADVVGGISSPFGSMLVRPIVDDGLPSLRREVRERLLAAGLRGSAADSFVMAIHEAAVNALEHAGGGRVWLWQHRGNIWCEVSDDGPGMTDPMARVAENPMTNGHAHVGLWLIGRACPDVQITSTAEGTRLLMRRRISLQASDSPASSAAEG